MAVDPAYHRRGAGSRLMEYGVEIADKLGFEVCILSLTPGNGCTD